MNQKKKEEKKLPEIIIDPEVTKFVNNPFVPNSEKQIRTEKYYERKEKEKKEKENQIKNKKSSRDEYPGNSGFPYKVMPPGYNNQPSVNVQVYQPPQQQNTQSKPKHFNDVVDMMPFYAQNPTISTNLIDVPRYSVINKSVINLDGGPNANHKAISNVYENIFPKKKIDLSFYCLKNRLIMTNYIRSVLIKDGDGEVKPLDAYSSDSLIGHLKLLHLNPFGDTTISSNPYDSLPDNMLIYSSCYPIKYNSEKNTTICAANSTGMMVKIFKMSDEQNKLYGYKKKWKDGDGVISALYFYNIIVHDAINNNKCPHFIRMHAYYTYENSYIDFTNLKNAKVKTGGGMIPGSFMGQPSNNQQEINPIDNIGPLKEVMITKQNEIITGGVNDPKTTKCVIILTEAPTYTYNSFSENKYDVSGKHNIHIYSNTHSEELKFTVKFQKEYTQNYLKSIGVSHIFNDTSGIYVKDINANIHGKYWVYVVDNIKYYIPNYGFIVLFDVTLSTKDTFETKAKTKANTSIANMASKYKKYLHNRIGTVVTQSEIQNIIMDGSTSTFLTGELAVIKEENEYKYVLIVGKDASGKYNCILNTGRGMTTSKKKVSDLYKLYSQTVKQNNNGFIFDEANLIETYSI